MIALFYFYILGVLLALVHLAYKTYLATEKTAPYLVCVFTILNDIKGLMEI
jgi:hypothetical protein